MMSSKRIVGHIDSNGEVFEGAALALIFPKRRNGFGEGWVAMAQPALMALATGNFGEQAYKVLFGVIAMLDFENWIQLNQSELSEKLNMNRQNFNRALFKLENEKILLRGPRVGRCTTFRLNPNYGWKGSAKKHNEALQQKMDKLGLSVIEKKDA